MKVHHFKCKVGAMYTNKKSYESWEWRWIPATCCAAPLYGKKLSEYTAKAQQIWVKQTLEGHEPEIKANF